MGMIAYYAIPVSDDIYYSLVYREYLIDNKVFPGLKPWNNFFFFHYLEFNGRLGDKFMPLIMLMPRGLYALFFSVIMFIILRISSLIVGCKKLGTLILSSLIILLMPSYDFIFLRNIFLNYVVTCALTLCWIYLFFSIKNESILINLVIFLFSIIVGSWHEFFTVSLIFGTGLFVLFDKNFRDIKHFLMAFGLGLGCCFIFLSKGNFMRAELLQPGSAFNLIDAIAGTWIGILSIFICIIYYIRFKSQISKQDKIIFFSFLFILVFTFVINYIHRSSPRLGWLTNILAILILAILAKRIRQPNKILRNIFAICVMIFAVLNLLFTLYWQRKIWIDYQHVIKEFKSSRGNIIYYDINVSKWANLLSLGKIEKFAFYSFENNLNGYLFLGEDKELRVVPTELKNIRESELKSFENNYYLTPKGNILIKRKENLIQYKKYYLSDKKGYRISFQAFTVPFTLNGSDWLYFYPFYEYWERDQDIPSKLTEGYIVTE